MSKSDYFLAFVDVLSVEAVRPTEYDLNILDVSLRTQTKTKMCVHHIIVFLTVGFRHGLATSFLALEIEIWSKISLYCYILHPTRRKSNSDCLLTIESSSK